MGLHGLPGRGGLRLLGEPFGEEFADERRLEGEDGGADGLLFDEGAGALHAGSCPGADVPVDACHWEK